MARRTLSPEQREKYAAQRQEELAQAHARIAEKATELVNGEQWQNWLRVAAKFHRYSFNNTLMILLQRPDATQVAGYNAWRDTFKRQVNKGEKGIRILAPVTKTVEKLDANGKPILNAEGKPEKVVKLVGTKLTSVFDVSQTSGEPLPERPTPQLLRGEAPPGLWDALAEVVQQEGFTLERGDCGTANGWTNHDSRVVRVRQDVDDAQAVKTLAHELGHVLLHGQENPAARSQCRGRIEVEAESVAYLITQAHGLDSGQYTFSYVAWWADAEVEGSDKTLHEVIAGTGARVVKVAHQVLEHTQSEDMMLSSLGQTAAADLTQSVDTSQLLQRAEKLGDARAVAAPQAGYRAPERPPAGQELGRTLSH